ncbi:RDD family protein [Anaerobacillus sp. CMMVII]|uniref:RDD family protein n=1 Tax=Anaerobacillus sp. CMMVII TaxID=2755588 RepID=UPI0021B76858|nr:RDD family protein [Anaerobacillus sp. CMMVII]MCT8136742.1 RDD family protein [Anaerobacillus sp. CMMVII]
MHSNQTPAHENPAGFGERFFAQILDFLIIFLPIGILSYTISGELTLPFDILMFLYGIILPVVWKGYTVGKKIMGIRIVKMNGDQVGIGTMLLRNLVSGLIYTLTFGIGSIVSFFMVIFREDKRAIHDLIAGTIVTFHTPD